MKSHSNLPYTLPEIRTIRDMAGSFNAKEIGREIGRSASSVIHMAAEQKISLKVTKPKPLTENEQNVMDSLSPLEFRTTREGMALTGLKLSKFRAVAKRLVKLGRLEESLTKDNGLIMSTYRIVPEHYFGVSPRLYEFNQLLRGAHAI